MPDDVANAAIVGGDAMTGNTLLCGRTLRPAPCVDLRVRLPLGVSGLLHYDTTRVSAVGRPDPSYVNAIVTVFVVVPT